MCCPSWTAITQSGWLDWWNLGIACDSSSWRVGGHTQPFFYARSLRWCACMEIDYLVTTINFRYGLRIARQKLNASAACHTFMSNSIFRPPLLQSAYMNKNMLRGTAYLQSKQGSVRASHLPPHLSLQWNVYIHAHKLLVTCRTCRWHTRNRAPVMISIAIHVQYTRDMRMIRAVRFRVHWGCLTYPYIINMKTYVSISQCFTRPHWIYIKCTYILCYGIDLGEPWEMKKKKVIILAWTIFSNIIIIHREYEREREKEP